MYLKRLLAALLITTGAIYADGTLDFTLDGKAYSLTGAQTALVQKNNKLQLVIGKTDKTQRIQFALNIELPELKAPVTLTSENNAISLVVISTTGMYSVIPHTSLAHDDFMRYIRRKEVVTGEMEDDPTDKPEERIPECWPRHHHAPHIETANRFNKDYCNKLIKRQRKQRRKVRVEFVEEAPTWVNKTREQRIATGDGIMREKQYENTLFQVNLVPTVVDGKITALTGSFGGVIRFVEGPNRAREVLLSNGSFIVPVTYAK
ncbi:MAG: hypothetical protein LDLANPLL_02752 [Turneriella sp.]|nr:hypothetical protein [Turneriella sp.]